MPCSRNSPSPAHLPRPVHDFRLLHPPCSCGVACALHRAAFGETFEYGDDLGVYARALFELRTLDYVSLSAFALRRRRLRARVNRRRASVDTLNLHVE